MRSFNHLGNSFYTEIDNNQQTIYNQQFLISNISSQLSNYSDQSQPINNQNTQIHSQAFNIENENRTSFLIKIEEEENQMEKEVMISEELKKLMALFLMRSDQEIYQLVKEINLSKNEL